MASVELMTFANAANVWSNGNGRMTGNMKFDELAYTASIVGLVMLTLPSTTFGRDCIVLPSALNKVTLPLIVENEVVFVALVIVIVAPLPTNFVVLTLSHTHLVTFHVQDWPLLTANALPGSVALTIGMPAKVASIMTPKNDAMHSFFTIFKVGSPS